MISVTCSMPLPSAANQSEHWAVRAARAKKQRSQAFLALRSTGPWQGPSGEVQIILTRIGPRRLDDDNLAYAFKAARDGVADFLGIDDGDPRLKWLYAQRKAGPGEPRRCVQITVIGREA